MSGIHDKVTAFVVRPAAAGFDLLLFRHHAGSIQLPAGTVELDETPRSAGLREAREETGLADLTIARELGAIETPLTDERRVLLTTTTVYARPTVRSFDWARLRRGLWVRCERRQAGFAHVTYAEWDRMDDPRYISYQITGWVPEAALASVERRHFYLLTVAGPTPERWEVDDDGQQFSLFWAPLAALPPLGTFQTAWLAMLPAEYRR
jgi:8-oxo-dGTP pyrophosphatase MutT (NUDIX family)